MNVNGYEIKPNASLRGASLRGASLRGASLFGADLCGASLRDANLRGADLRGANLFGADLCGASLCGASLRDADLRDADLRGANLCDADLCDADLRGASGIQSFGPAPTSGRMVYAVWHGNKWLVKAGCFWGGLNELTVNVDRNHNSPWYHGIINFLLNYSPSTHQQ